MLGLHPNVIALLESDPGKTHVDAVPLLSDTDPKNLPVEAGGGTITSPFTFRPQRLRLNKDHEFFEDGDVHRHLYLQDLATSATQDPQPAKVCEFRCHISGCSQQFDSLQGYEHHYSSLHRHVCATCRRCLPSARLLDIHIQEWHDSLFAVMAQKQSMYQCLVEGCDLRFSSSLQRKDHLVRTHSYPPDFRFDKSKKSKRVKERLVVGEKSAGMEVCVDAGSRSESRGSEEPCEGMDVADEIPGSIADVTETPSSIADDTHSSGSIADDTHTSGSVAQGGHAVPPETQNTPSQKPRYTYRVPQSICFGQGSVRGFRGGRRKK
ncbi:zinc finger protein 511 [Engraulis encrasicolus]|uniref:zinc finger protein 511 n=1 Tax=Engraulis encrasicolus TaxID=184585 RepID=UPI002FD4DBE3